MFNKSREERSTFRLVVRTVKALSDLLDYFIIQFALSFSPLDPHMPPGIFETCREIDKLDNDRLRLMIGRVGANLGSYTAVLLRGANVMTACIILHTLNVAAC